MNRALMSEIQSIWVNFERKADSPNLLKTKEIKIGMERLE